MPFLQIDIVRAQVLRFHSLVKGKKIFMITLVIKYIMIEYTNLVLELEDTEY